MYRSLLRLLSRNFCKSLLRINRVANEENMLMSTVELKKNIEDDPRVLAVFDDIRTTRKTDSINNFWRYIAVDATLLEETWREVKTVMATPSTIEPHIKEMIYIAVSITNNCHYCIHSHTASARAQGMQDDQYVELLRIVSLAGKTNQLANGIQVPVDDDFLK